MSQRPINRSPDLKRLRDEGYDIEVRSGYLVVNDVPYANGQRAVKRGSFIFKLNLADDIAQKPDDHTAYFAGEYPCDQHGAPIERIRNNSNRVQLADGLFADHYFSAKPNPPFADYYSKVTTYVAIVSGPAQAIDRSATAQTYPVIKADDDESVFEYVDTASSRAGIMVATEKLAQGRIAIVGLGGTGAYVLDLVSKTPVPEIHLYDGDPFLQHNAFRSPGAVSGEDLGKKLSKTTHFAEVYSKVRKGIIDHPTNVTEQNVGELQQMNFVFVCIDDGPSRQLIIPRLQEWSVPFTDVGVGLYLVEGAIGGIVRVTTSTANRPSDINIAKRIPFGVNEDGENEYRTNIQIADLNALNAALAVIRWKKLCGFYHDFDHEHHSTYTIDGNLLTNEDKAQAQRAVEA
jgi:ThiF family